MPGPPDDELGQMATSPLDVRTGAPEAAAADVSAEVRRALGQRYDLQAELGRGGMGIVFRARDRETGDTVALKVLRPEIANNPELLERFKAELLLARKVTHKNVCRVHELIRLGPVAAIAMEYVEGESLREVLRREQGASLRYALKLTRQILAGLHEAHEQGVVHRDLKPENILIARDGTVKVMDFGIALSASAPATKEGGIAGTPAYMSPEQAQGKPADARSDIYSLGLVLYELFCGAPPFTAESTTDLLKKQVTHEPPAPRTLEPNLPDYLERVILKCLAKDPARRFQSVAAMQAALEEQRPMDLSEEAHLIPPAEESSWRARDSVLLALGAFGLLTLFIFHNRVFPADLWKLEIDANAARREAESVLRRAGWPDIFFDHARLEYSPDDYVFRLLAPARSPGARSRSGFQAVRETEFPLSWFVVFRSSLHEFSEFAAPEERYVRLDRRGKVLEMRYAVSQDFVGRDYRPPPVEERRRKAAQAATEICGSAPPSALPVETSGGVYGAHYTARWRQQEIALVGERVTLARCSIPIAAPDAEASRIFLVAQTKKVFRGMGAVLVLILFAGLLIAMVRTQAHRSPFFWKRLPVAAAAGLPAGWLLGPGLTDTPYGAAGHILGGLAATVMFLLGIVVTEHLLMRRWPLLAASLHLALSGRCLEPLVGLSILRGLLAGLVLIGLQTGMVALSLQLAPPGAEGRPGFFASVLASYVDPTPLGFALASEWPAAYVAASAIFHSVLIGIVLLGWGYVDTYRWTRDLDPAKGRWRARISWAALYILIGLNLTLLSVGLRLHIASTLGVALATLFVPFFIGTGLSWSYRRFGALAAMMCVATLVLLPMCFSLTFMLREVGNATVWAVLAGWAAVVAGGVYVAFRGRWPQILESAEST